MHTNAPPILMYHAVAALPRDPDRISVSPACFREQIGWLARAGYRGVSVGELVRAHARSSARGLVGLTFDDGYRSVLEHAAPVLRQVGFTATVFPVVERLGWHNAWDPQGPHLATLTVEELRALREHGVEIGSHTLTHPMLTRARPDHQAREIAQSRLRLAELLGQAPAGLSYPFGDVDAAVARLARTAGYAYACAVDTHRGWHRHALPRIRVAEVDGPWRLRLRLARRDRGPRRPAVPR